MKKIIMLALALLVPAAAYAADPLLDRPRWSLELKGGSFYPAIENWDKYYGDDKTSHYAGSLAYKLIRQLEVGIEGGRIKDKGQGLAPGHGILAGAVTYELAPLNVFMLFRGVFSEKQWLAPYIGGGWTRMYYRQKIQHQETVRGSADGYHVRGGLQFALDRIDQSAANSMYMEYGVYHTYFFCRGATDKSKGTIRVS